MQPTIIRFRGILTARILERAAGLTVISQDGCIVLSGHLSPADLRALVDVLVALHRPIVDVSGAQMGDAPDP